MARGHRRSWLGRVAVAVALALTLCGIIATGHAPPPLVGPLPTLPHYPNTIGEARYPNDDWELRLLGEGFGGFQTPDSVAEVRRWYDEQLAHRGWRDRWYQNAFGYCFTLLIIPSYSTATSKGIHITFKLRQAFASELGKNAPAGCK